MQVQVARRVLCAVALQLLLCGSVAPPDVQDRVFKYRSYRLFVATRWSQAD